VAQKELNLLQFAAGGAAEAAQLRRRSCGASLLTPILAANSLTTCHTSFSVTASPQTLRRASSARSRLPLICSRSGACQSACQCSAVNQLPTLTPSFFTPLTCRIPAARSALSSPQSAASYASRRTAPRRRLMVPVAGFQMHSVPHDYGLAERQPWLGAVPLHEFVNSMPIAPLGIWAREAV
jgi:hypothetical protein